jgi:hypothetical protein
VWTGDREAELVLAVDHIAFDGGSVRVVLDELAAGIGAAQPSGPVPQLSGLATGDPAGATSLAYWRAALDGAAPPYDLPGRPDTLLVVRFPRRLFRRRDESFGAALTGGWRFIARRRPFALMIGYFVPVNYLSAVTLVLITPLVLGFGSPVTLGVVTAVGGLGAVVGSLMMVAWGGTRRRADGMIGFVSLVGAGTLLLGVHPATGPVAAGLFLWWAATSILNAHWLAILQVKVGLELQGRVLAVNQMLATAMMPLGFVSAPALARLIDPGAVLVGSGALLVAWGVLGLRYRPLRHLEDSLPDAVAGPEIAEDLDELQAEIDARLAPDRRGCPSGAGTMAR